MLISLFFYHLTYYVNAQSTEELDKALREKQSQIRDLERQLSDTQTKEKSLKSELKIIDDRTKLTELKIQETEFQITKLNKEIEDLGNRISRLSTSVDSISEVLLNRIVSTYKYNNVSPIDLIFSSTGFADLLEKVKYMEVAQANDKKVLYQLQATKAAYNDQKTDKESRQLQQQVLQKDLEKLKVELTEQKKAKDDLLKVTQNNEVRFQQELSRLRADANSILSAISNIGAKIGDVQKGDVIGVQGNTGCVAPPPPSGHHLHFEVYRDAKVSGGAIVDIITGENIQFRYSSHLVNPNDKLRSGEWASPISVYPNDITTGFGETSVFGTPHTGIDIAGPLYSPIYAVDKGVAYAASGPVCDSAMKYNPGTTSAARGRIIDHQNGWVTLYWHMMN